jgi:hypothetical protein
VTALSSYLEPGNIKINCTKRELFLTELTLLVSLNSRRKSSRGKLRRDLPKERETMKVSTINKNPNLLTRF